MEWNDVNDKTKIMPKNKDFLLLFESGNIQRFLEDDLEFNLITHWCEMPKRPKRSKRIEKL